MEADFWPESRFLLISQAGGRESCSSFHTESAERRKGDTFLFKTSAAPRLLLPWRVSCGYVCRSAGWCGLTVLGHMCRIPFSSYTLVGGTERKGKFVVCLIIYF